MPARLYRASICRSSGIRRPWETGPTRAAWGFPWRDHPTLAEIATEEGSGPDIDGGHEELAAEVSSGALVVGGHSPANASQRRSRSRAKARVEAEGADRPAAERVSRPGRGRSRPATSEIMDVTAGETAPVSPQPVAKEPVAVPSDPLPSPVRSPSAERIALPAVSAMEAEAARWHRKSQLKPEPLAPVPVDDGKVWCVGCDARVPLWFGRDCISGTCSLKGLVR